MAKPAGGSYGRAGAVAAPDLESMAPLITRVGRSIEGPLVGAANLLDVPGSMARDLLMSAATGKWHNPFDQLLSPTSSQNRSTGRDLRVALGLGRRNARGFGATVADILTEGVTDPLSWINPLGAWTKAGKIAQAAGLMSDVGRVAKAAGRIATPRVAQTTTTLGDLVHAAKAGAAGPQTAEYLAAARAAGGAAKLQKHLDQPLRGALGVPGGALGHGATAQRIAGMQDAIGHAVRYSRPVRAAARVMHKPVEGIATTRVQKEAADWFRERQRIRSENQGWILKKTEQFRKFQQNAGPIGPGSAAELSARNLRAVLENPSTAKNLAGVDLPTRREWYQQFPGMERYVDDIMTELEAMPDKAAAAHLRHSLLFDVESEYFPAYKSAGLLEKGGAGKGPAVFNTFDPSFQLSRMPWRKHIAGGTEGIKIMLQDPDLQRLLFRTGPTSAVRGGHSPHTHAGMTAIEALSHPEIKNWLPATRDEIKDLLHNKYHDFFDWHDPAYGPSQNQAIDQMAVWLLDQTPSSMAVGVWGNHPLADLAVRRLHLNDSIGASNRIMDMLSDKEFLQWQGRSGKKVALTQVLDNAGLDSKTAIADLGKRLKMTPENVADIHIAKEYADDLAAFAKGFTAPDSTGPLREGLDWFNNTFRALVTGPYPAFHGRNLASSQFMNWVSRMWSGWSVAAAHNLLTGKGHDKLGTIPLIAERLAAEGLPNTKEAAADMARRLLAEHEIAPHGGAGDIADVLGPLGQIEVSDLKSLTRQYPGGLGGESPIRFGDIGRKAVGLDPTTTWAPWAVRGVGGRTKSNFTLGAAGEELGGYIEGLARISPFLHLLEKGWDPHVAAQRVKAAQVDYSGRMYTQAERQVMTRLFPFYKFTSRTLPAHLRMLIDSPGGRLAQTFRGVAGLRGEDQGPLPEHIADTSAIPIPEGVPLIGPKPGGDPRYLTGLGMMFEDAASMMPFGGAGLQGSGLELLSRTNPLLKGIMEGATGQSFFQRGATGGRPLEDLDPTIGRTLRNFQQLYTGEGTEGYSRPVRYPGDQYVEALIGNSPLARASTTLRTASDPRKSFGAKAANLLTGLRLSDVSDAAKSAAIQQRVVSLLKQYPQTRQFQRTYIPKDRLPEMSEGDRVQAQQLLELLNLLAERGRKERRQAKAR